MARGISIITGGLGYIGQCLAQYLGEQGERPVIIDRRRVPNRADAPVVTGDIADPATWDAFRGETIDAIFHCAGLIQVGESVSNPLPYFRDNVAASLAMLGWLRSFGSIPIVFSSSAAVYGDPVSAPIPESADLAPLSPYGVTKRQFEEVLQAFYHAYGQPYVALRYFNACGRYGAIQENHEPETHLLPRLCGWFRDGNPATVYGADYPTKDGTAVRDYVHVKDLASAHWTALEYLRSGGQPMPINIGSGQGASVMDVVHAFSHHVPGMPDPVFHERRRGDPAVLVADITRARQVLEFEPQYSEIENVVRDVWESQR